MKIIKNNVQYDIKNGEARVDKPVDKNVEEIEILSEVDNTPVTKIQSYAFCQHHNLKSAKLPDSIKSMGYGAFQLCRNLEEINLPKNLENIGRHVFHDCKSLKEIILPEKLKTIDEGAFFGCNSLESIVIPNSVKKIGKVAFKSCPSLKKVTFINNDKEISIEPSTFDSHVVFDIKNDKGKKSPLVDSTKNNNEPKR